MSLTIAALAVLAGLSEPAAPRVVVRWDAPAGCPDASSVSESIRLLSAAEVLEGDEAAGAPQEGAELVATGSVTLGAEGYGLSLTLASARNTQVRQLEAADCTVLARAAALVVVVALDPVELAMRLPEREPQPQPELVPNPEPALEPDPVPAPEPIPEREPEPVAQRERAPPLRLNLGPLEYGVGVGIGVSALALPGVGPALDLSPFLGVRRVHARLVAQYRTPRRRALEDNPNAGARFQLAAGGARLCPNVVPRDGRIRVPLCLGIDLGAVIGSARGDNVRNPGDATSFWSAGTLEAGVAVQVARWVSVTAAFEAGIALSRPRFVLEGGGVLHESARFAPRGIVGVQFHRPRAAP